MSPNDYLKKIPMPHLNDVLAYSGLQRSPSTLNKFLTGAGLIGFGALAGAGLGLLLGSAQNRRRLSTMLTDFGKATAPVSNGIGKHDGMQASPGVVVR